MKNNSAGKMVSIKFLAFVAFSLILNSSNAYAKSAGTVSATLPAGVIYPTPVGIVYPGFNIAAGVNAAALAVGKKVTSIQATVSPELEAGTGNSGMLSVATSSQKLGWSLGYTGSMGDTQTHGIVAGVGFKLSQFSFGVGLRDSDFGTGGFDPGVDVGTRIELGKEFSLAGVAYDLDATSMSYAVGIGFGKPKRDNVELNLLVPADASDYGATFAATVYSGIFGTTFRTTYYIQSKTFSHTIGGLIWFSNSMNFLVQLTSPRQLALGVTWIF